MNLVEFHTTIIRENGIILQNNLTPYKATTMKTILKILSLDFLLLTCLFAELQASNLQEESSWSFEAIDMHPDEWLLSWKGDLASKVWDRFIVFVVEGKTTRKVSEVEYQKGSNTYHTIIKAISRDPIHLQLVGVSEDGEQQKLGELKMLAQEDRLSVTPLKSANVIHIKAPSGKCALKILDEKGQLIRAIELSKRHSPIDISWLDSGKYRLIMEGKTAQEAKFERL